MLRGRPHIFKLCFQYSSRQLEKGMRPLSQINLVQSQCRALSFNFSHHSRLVPSSGILVLRRHESTTKVSASSIPPLTSEVFSKQESSSAVSTPPASSTQAVADTSTVNASTAPAAQSPPVIEAIPSDVAASVGEALGDKSSSSLVWESIPEAPPIPDVAETLALALSSNGEPTLVSLGLGGWSPSGIVQTCLEFAHCDMGLPWWGAIMLGTVCVRLLVFPLVIKSQRNAAKMTNNMPQMQTLQLKMTEARQTGNSLLAAKYGQELMQFMKEKEVNPIKSLWVPIAMAPVFISFFFGLRKMANLPVESMKEGGLFWFTDLTLADPYYILPLLTSLTLFITMEVGVDGVRLSASTHGQTMRYVMRCIPIIVFPLTMNFPAAILCYWASTNAVSLIQVSLLKIPGLREKLKIDPIRKLTQEMLPIKKKPFKQSIKDSWTNIKISREMEDRAKYDEVSFKRAGRGPIPKTYKYDPTKTSIPANAIQAKQK